MHKRLNSRILLFILVPTCLVFLFLGFFITNSKNPNDNIAPLFASPEKIIPIRITIPSIKVEALIKPVGLTKLKTMESPEEPLDTAWFKLGASPGEKGSSVIAGHRGWKTGRAIFDDLDEIQLGDKVYVENEKGDILVFVVREMRVYGALEIVPEVWNKNDAAYLNLITCSGDWNASTGTSDKRLVVFTDLAT
ncbi:MAG: class F sortase [Minisyncoccia bacterium]